MRSPVLVGRERELGLLVGAAIGAPAVAFVSGEAGIGKTRLVRELACHPALGDWRVLFGNCHRLREPFWLGPVVEALCDVTRQKITRPLSSVTGALRPLVPELAHHLPPAPDPLGDDSAQRHRIFRAVRELLAGLGPCLCIMEDLQWADAGTIELLSFLLSRPPEGLTLVLSHRGEDVRPLSPLMALGSGLPPEVLEVTVELSALTAHETHSFIAAIFEDEAVSRELVHHLHERTAGIPLAIEEALGLLGSLAGTPSLDRISSAGALEAVGVPQSIRQSILERLGSLNGDARLAARAAAVLGTPASKGLIALVAGLTGVRSMRGVKQALSVAVLYEQLDGVYAFRHPLACQAVYEEIPGVERRRLHLRAARALESGWGQCSPSQLGHHYRHAGQAGQWARCVDAAARAAIAAGDDQSAVRLLEEALASDEVPHTSRVGLAIALGRAALYSTSPQRAIDFLQRTLDEEVMAVGARGELRFCLSRLRYHAGDREAARSELMRAVGELKRKPELAARAMVNVAVAVLADGQGEDHRPWLRRAVAAVEGQDDRVARVAVFAQRAAILLNEGDPAGWAAVRVLPTQGSSVEEKVQLLRGYHSIFGAALGLGHHRRAESFLAAAQEIQRELNHVSWVPWLETARVCIDWRFGRWEALERRARELIESSDIPVLSLCNHLVLGSLSLSRGELDEAECSLSSAVDLAARAAGPPAARGALARVRLARGDPEAARRVAMAAFDGARRNGTWLGAATAAPVIVQAMVYDGDTAAAHGLIQELSAGLRGRDAPFAAAALSLSRAALAEATGRHDSALLLFGEAERAWRALPCPYEAALARERGARCMLTANAERGSEMLFGALRTFEGLGASWDAARVLAELRAARVRLPYPWRGGRKGYGEVLSPREAQIARLAAMGQTNRQIAEALFISKRTVEGHVASALRKQGAASREALKSEAESSKDTYPYG